jgi:CDP-6-deoxy-D-xylo-4-hexulose-3-dehydrase
MADKKVWYAPNKFESYGQEEIKAVTDCLNDGWLAGFGPKTVDFENKISEYFGKKFGVFVNSGSSACLLALAALDLPAGSEVITPACTFSTTVAPIIQLGLRPVFCDVMPTAYVPSVDAVLEKITPLTRVIMLPNLIGNLADWKGLRERLPRSDIWLVEDSADTMIHSPWSDVSTTSFYASHIITACGSGGMVMFNHESHRNRALMFRDWGRLGDNSELVSDRFNHVVDGIPYDHKFLYGCLGYNFKSSEVNAAFGLVQLEKFEKFKEIRRTNFRRYMDNLADLSQITLPDDSRGPNWLAIPLQCEERMELLSFLEANNIQTRVTFSGNITRHPAFREHLQEFEAADRIMRNGFLLGCHHGMTTDDVDYVCLKIKEFYKSRDVQGLSGDASLA